MIFPKEALYFVASYLAIIFFGLMLLNWLSNGVLIKFIKIKASRGSKIMVKLHNKLKTYIVPGWLEGDDLLYFDNESKANKQKTPKRITCQDKSIFYRFMGVWACDIDESTNNIIKHDGSVLPGFDVIRWNNLYLRALMKPASEEKNNLIMIIMLVAIVVILFVCIAMFVKIQSIGGVINTIGAVKQAAVAGVNIP